MTQWEKWLEKAKNDLLSSKILYENKLFDTAVYHCQQCCEKAIKGYLSFKQKPIQKTHDITELINICIGLDDDFAEIIEDSKIITPYSTYFRYPDVIDLPEKKDVDEAIMIAEKILNFIIKKIKT